MRFVNTVDDDDDDDDDDDEHHNDYVDCGLHFIRSEIRKVTYRSTAEQQSFRDTIKSSK